VTDLGVTKAACVAGGVRGLCGALVQGKAIAYREALSVYGAAGGLAVLARALVPTTDVV
jgi:hypothetical protein